ncbi:ATP-binding cassette domain-containing protein [Agrococcus sp. Marseille-P2731]|uniref:ATP-binding cassette domain-containing protein n=1 Tax=Agrococcus sp. Marseille-P2731 TaxID=1841862 RepID=UPI001F2E0776|nr:excinuclease ABC subunit UvrA [Agrococcus sp. Marseille-P2731]
MTEQISVRGARENNLKAVDVDIPKRRLSVFTGVSGSGKSSLVFGTIAAESRRLIDETYEAFVQGFMPPAPQPEADSLEGLTAAILVGQDQMGANSRSTVGTATDAYTMLRVLWSRVGTPRLDSSVLFSFNDPRGMCLVCEGLGRVSAIDVDAIVDRSKSLDDGAIDFPNYQVGGWYWKLYAESGLLDPAKRIADYSDDELQTFLHGEERKVTFAGFNMTYEGLIPKLKKSVFVKDPESMKPALRARVEAAATFGDCEACGGSRLNAAAREVRVEGITIAEATAMQLTDLAPFIAGIPAGAGGAATAPLRAKLVDLLETFDAIGLGYLSLDRPAGSLSGGEAQRTKMVRHMGSALTDVTYVFDEPTAGLHAHDVERMNGLLQRLRDKGNTVLVVEHKPEVMAIADRIVDMGPGAGTHGGTIVFQGTFDELRASGTRTGEHLEHRQQMKESVRAPQGHIEIRDARSHNLTGVDVDVPTGVLVAVTGVAGSGKSSLIHGSLPREGVTFVDQTVIKGSRRSNPATYTGILEPIRKAFATANKVKPALFSANSEGACPECKGLGVIYSDLAFMAGVTTPCELCGGRRFTAEVLEYELRGKSIGDVLDMSIEEASAFFTEKQVAPMLGRLVDVGLGYITLGQTLTTLSGGERQRLKLAIEMGTTASVIVLDEPTTGLHMADVDNLIGLLERIVDAGRTVIVIEHNLDVVSRADWLIDLGPGAGAQGGRVVFEGTPAALAAEPGDSLTGRHLAKRRSSSATAF